jgi:hypothetical protein
LAQAEVSPDADVSGIKAKMTRAQLMQLTQSLSRPSQQVELIADHEQLQVANDALQHEQRGWQSNRALVNGGTAQEESEKNGASPTTRPVTPLLEQVAEAPAAATAAPAPRVALKQGEPTTRRSEINMKAGPGPTTAPSPAGAAGEQQQRQVARMPSSDYRMRQGSGPRQEPIRAGEKLNVTIDELAAAGGERTVVADVAADGTIRLPKLREPIRIEGRSREEAARDIADAFMDTAGFERATVKVEPATGATTQRSFDAVASSGARGGSSTRPDALGDRVAGRPQRETADKPAEQAAPSDVANAAVATTQTTPSTAPADEEPLDVVILVQTNNAGEAAAPSQSQPAPINGDITPSDEADVPAAPEKTPTELNAAPDVGTDSKPADGTSSDVVKPNE